MCIRDSLYTASDIWFLLFSYIFFIPICIENFKNITQNIQKVVSIYLLFDIIFLSTTFILIFYYVYWIKIQVLDPTTPDENQIDLIKFAIKVFGIYFSFFIISTIILNFFDKDSTKSSNDRNEISEIGTI